MDRQFPTRQKPQLQFNGTISERISTPAEVPHGSPLSPLLYMFYNAELLDIAAQHRATGLGFIDNIVYGIQGNTDKENARKLKCILNEAEQWRKKHGAQLETSKYILVHYARNRSISYSQWGHNRIIERSQISRSYLQSITTIQVTSTAYSQKRL